MDSQLYDKHQMHRRVQLQTFSIRVKNERLTFQVLRVARVQLVDINSDFNSNLNTRRVKCELVKIGLDYARRRCGLCESKMLFTLPHVFV